MCIMTKPEKTATNSMLPSRSARRKHLGGVLAALLALLGVGMLLWLTVPARAAGVIIHVAPTGTDAATCGSVLAPCRTIQYAVNLPGGGAEIRVATGVYTGSGNQVVWLNENLTLRGGFTTSNWLTPDPAINPTIIDGENVRRGVLIDANPTVIVSGFHIRNGRVIATNEPGAGIFNKYGTAAIEDCQVYNNVAPGTSPGGSPGGGVANGDGASVSYLTLRRNRIFNNQAAFYGGGVANVSGQTTMERNRIYNNTARVGAGFSIFRGSLISKNDLIYGNTTAANGSGGGIAIDNAATAVTLLNNTIYSNSATNDGGGVVVFAGTRVVTVTITNTLIISNTAVISGGAIQIQGTPITVSYTDFYGNIPNDYTPPVGQENRTGVNPNFVAPGAGDFRLIPGSPAIDTGMALTAVSEDALGYGRPFGAGWDRGAHEYTADAACYARIQARQVYTSVQAAVTGAASGDVVQVAGRCVGAVTIEKALTLRGGYTVTDWANFSYGPTVLDGESTRRVLRISGGAVTVENLHITGGLADFGAGIYVESSAAQLTLRNAVLYGNTALQNGGGLYNGGTATVDFSTFYSNTAGQGGALYTWSALTLTNSAIVANSGHGLYRANDATVTADYNAFDGNTPGDGNVAPGRHDVRVSPLFVNPSAGNFHVQLSSPLINAADPAATLAYDFEGDPRPRGERADIGADERLFFAAVDLTPADPVIRENLADLQGRTFTFTHTIKNTGYTTNLTDTYDIVVVNEDGLEVSPAQVSGIGLRLDETQQIQVAVKVPSTVTAGFYNRTFVTATSRTSPNAYAVAVDAIANPGLIFEPDHTMTADPGEYITYTHTLTNVGPADMVMLTLTTSHGWGELLSPEEPLVALGPNETLEVIVRVQVPLYAALGVRDETVVRATSQAFGTFDTVTNRTTAKATTGTRYVRVGGTDPNNNCTQPDKACATPGHAVMQAAGGDSIIIAEGTYHSSELILDRPISLLAGYRFSAGKFTEVAGGPKPSATILDFNNTLRGVRIEPAGGVGSGPLLRGFTIRNASAGSANGGAVLLVGSASVRLSNLRLENVRAAVGGALYVSNGVANLDQVWVTNAQAQQGGALYNANGSIIANRLLIEQSLATTGAGGAVYNAGPASLRLDNSIIYSSTAATGGGALYNAGTLTAWNNTLAYNQAATFGGGLYDHNSASLLVRNTIFYKNTAGTAGGGLHRTNPEMPNHGYNTFWDNQAPQYAQRNFSPAPSDVPADPLFVDPAAGDFRLTLDSPVMDMGDPATPLTEDFYGNPRPSNHGYDIGANESRGCLARVLDPVTGKQTGPLFNGVQQAVDFAPAGAVIQIHGVCFGVQPRLYAEDTVYQTIYISKSLTLRGGYPATFDQHVFEETIIDALDRGRVVLLTSPTTTTTLQVTLARLTLRNGQVGAGQYGGVIYNDMDVNLRLDAVRIERGAAESGGGLYNRDGAQLTLGNTTFISNTASMYGGALYNEGWMHAISTTQFLANQALGRGGAIYNAGGQLHLNAVTVLNNSAQSGGGLYNTASGWLALTNSLVVSNTVTGNGGGLYNLARDLSVRHATFYGNVAQRGAAIYHSAATGALINSTLLVSNTAASDGGALYSVNAAPAFDYNGIYGNVPNNTNITPGTGTLLADPLFLSLDPASARFLRLPAGSPAEDTADPASPVIEDIDRKPRPSNQGFDIGASEVGDCYIRINGNLPTYGNIQRAIYDSSADDVLYIAGTCRGVNAVSHAGNTYYQTAFITKSLELRGGFTVTNWTEPDPLVYTTTLDAASLGRVVYITASPVVTMSGLHLVNGYANNGGGLFMDGGVFTLLESQVYSNTAGGNGGGFFQQAGVALLTGQNHFHHNAAAQGGALYHAGGALTLDGNFLRDNTATRGGAFYRAGGQTYVHNTFVYRNAAQQGAGFYNATGGVFWIRHNTFYANAAGGGGGGLYTQSHDPVVRSNIFADNTGAGHAIYSSITGFATPDYNGLHPISGALYQTVLSAHNVLAAPDFADAAADDFRPSDASPMLDRGDPAMALDHDFEGDLRPADQGFDIGADERRSCWARILRGAVDPEIFGPFASPQLAIDASEPGDIIQVTVGECRGVHTFVDGATTYYQTTHITHNLQLRGGFLRDFSQQVTNPLSYPDPEESTIFNAMNAGRALLIANTTVVTVENVNLAQGMASLGGGPDRGGALLVGGAQTILSRVGLYQSQAANGGALSLSLNPLNQQVTLDGVHVYSNTATLGGGLYVPGGVITITGAAEFGYNAAQNGGAIYNHNGRLVVAHKNVRLRYNQATQNGGAIYNRAGAAPQLLLTEAHLVNNTAQRGGGLYGELHSYLSVDRGARFYLNNAAQGGAIYGGGNGFNVQNTLIYINTAARGAGVYVVSGGMPLVQHDTIVGNVAGDQGGAVYAEGASGTPQIRNNIFQYNQANEGSAVYAAANSSLSYNNYYPAAVNEQVAGGVVAGPGNLNYDPTYVALPNLTDPQELPNVDFHLDQYSRLIDMGLDVGVPHDMDGHPRPVNRNPDIGADEYPECLARVASSGIIYGEIQAALNNAEVGDTVDVAEGMCYEHLQITQDVTIVGSWNKDFSGMTKDYPSSYVDAKKADRVVWVGAGVTANISRMSFDNGRVQGHGGGVYVDGGAVVTFGDCMVSGSYASQNGGGVYNAAGSTAQWSDTSVFSNDAGGDGGGTYNAAGSTVKICGGGTAYNEAVGNGGGIYNGSGDFTFCNHGVVGNVAGANGGGLYNNSTASMTIPNVRYVWNTAGSAGGGLYNIGNSMTLWHNTIYMNEAQEGGGVYNTGSGLSVNASIVANNVGGGIHSTQSGTASYTLRWNNAYSTNIIVNNELGANPRLTYGGRLRYLSPAIDAVPAGFSPILEDALLNPRPQLCAKDMGSHEYSVGVREFAWSETDGTTLLPGTTHTYVVTVTNQSEEWRVLSDPESTLGPGSGYTETLRVNWTTSRGWAQIVNVTNVTGLIITGTHATFDIGPGVTADILVRVTIPPHQYASVKTQPDTYETTRLTYETMDCRTPPMKGTITTIETLVTQDLSCVLQSGDLSASVRPGESVSYTHVITNVGNLTTTYALVTAPGFYAAAVVISPTTPITQMMPTVRLAPGMSTTVEMSVTVRPEIAAGLTDVATLIGSVNNVAQCTVGDYTTVLPTTGIRYVALNGADSTVNETLGGNLENLPDNNCTQPQIAPCQTLQHALGQSSPGEEIRIAAGLYNDVYTVTQGSETLTQMLYIAHPLTITGGYMADNWAASPPDHMAHPTVFDAGGAGRAIYIATGGPVRLERLALLGGVAAGLGGGPGAMDAGGNLYNAGADLHLNALRISGGYATLGGGLYSAAGELLLTNNLVYDNAAMEAGGGVYLHGGSAHLLNNTVYRNYAGQNGGAVYLEQGELTLTNNIIVEHTGSSLEAGGSGQRAAVHAEAVTSYAASHNLWYDNTSTDVSGIAIRGSQAVQLAPDFVDVISLPPNLYLEHASPAREASDPATPFALFPLGLDYANAPRLMGWRIDIGAYEYVIEPSFELVPAYRYTTPEPGAALAYTHTLRNTGEFTDTYALIWNSSRGWITDLDVVGPVTLGPGAEQLLTLTGAVPNSDSAGLLDVTFITVTSQMSAGAVRVARNETRANFTPNVSLTPATRAGNTDPGVAITYFYTVTNIGNGWDSYTLTVSTPPAGWQATIAPAMTPGLAPFGGTYSLQVTVTPPAGVPGGTTTVVTVTAISTFDGVTANTATATTTVNQVRAVRLTPNRTATITTESSVIYNHTLTNLGNASDTFTLTYTSSQNWPGVFLQPATLPVVLAAGESTAVQFQLTVPPGSGGVTDVSIITATIEGTTLRDSVMDTTNVTPHHNFTLLPTPLTRSAAPGNTVIFTHTLTNMGNLNDTYNLNLVSGRPLWVSFTPSPAVTLSSGQSAVITVTVAVPGDATAQTVVSTLTATSQGNSISRNVEDTVIVSVGPQPILGLRAHNDSPTVVGNSTSLSATYETGADITFTWYFGYGSATGMGQTVAHTYPAAGIYTAVVTASNVISTVTASTVVTITEEACVAPQITILTSDSPVTVGAPMHFTATVAGTQPVTYVWNFGGAGTRGGTDTHPIFTYNDAGAYTVTLVVRNACGEAEAMLTATVNPSIIIRGVELAPNHQRFAVPGSIIVYRHTITNTGNAADTFDLIWQSSQGWSATLTPMVISLGAGLSVPVTFTLTVPLDATLADTSMITATSRSDMTVFDTVADTTTPLLSSGAELEPDYLDGRVNPGETITYHHILTNTSVQAYTFEIELQSDTAWLVAVRPEGGFVVQAGVTHPVTITVTAPVDALSGTMQNLQVIARAQEEPTVLAYAIDRTTINQVFGVRLSPDAQGKHGLPGQTVVFTHTLTNQGNGMDTFAVEYSIAPHDWPVVVTPHSVTLKTGAAETITAVVTIPPTASGGVANVISVCATSQGDLDKSSCALDTVTVYETVMWRLYLPLVLRNYNPNLPDLMVTGIAVDPPSPVAGQTVAVRVTVQNQGPIAVSYGNNFYVDFYVNRVPQPRMQGDIPWGVQGNWFGVGQSHIFGSTYTFTSAGIHQLYAQADTDNSVMERDEWNNVYGPYLITVSEGQIQHLPPIQTPLPSQGPRPTPTPLP